MGRRGLEYTRTSKRGVVEIALILFAFLASDRAHSYVEVHLTCIPLVTFSSLISPRV